MLIKKSVCLDTNFPLALTLMKKTIRAHVHESYRFNFVKKNFCDTGLVLDFKGNL